MALPFVAARPASHKNCPTDFMRVEGGKFFIGGTRVALKGVNYFGSWRQPGLLTSGRNVEQYSVWAFYHDWDIGRIEADFQFLRTQLNATCVRIGTPSVSDFARLVTGHGYLPWYAENGEIAAPYRSRLIDVADAAVRNGLRVQLCLLWNIANEILSDGENFKPGAPRDVFYARQVQSVASALRNHPGVVAFSVGNEVLVRWKINTEHPTGYEPRAAGFMLRRFADLRAAAPHQLIALDEIAAVHKEFWFAPGMHFMAMADVDYSNHGRIFRMADKVDYLSSHFYPVKFTAADVGARMQPKLDDSLSQLSVYLQAASAAGKPVAFGEFGLKLAEEAIQPQDYDAFRDALFEQVLSAGQKQGLQGLLAWNALPTMQLRPGHYEINASTLNPFSRTEVDISEADGRRARILQMHPSFNLFRWQSTGDAPVATEAARAIAKAWPAFSAIPGSACTE